MELNPGSTSTESVILTFNTALYEGLEKDGYIALSSPNTFTMPNHSVFFFEFGQNSGIRDRDWR